MYHGTGKLYFDTKRKKRLFLLAILKTQHNLLDILKFVIVLDRQDFQDINQRQYQ